ncbi:hypothetical protein FACS189426_17850 [Bacteroidia bacterium]|nr:hypothetical protein FACS189426_17850 [Bacteroidia bacterium]GHV70259.1 hypothetical protein FACS189420_0620 [Bacteroidia bacterium]
MYLALGSIALNAIIDFGNDWIVFLFNYFKTQKAKFSKHNLHTEYCSGDKNGKIEVFGENLNIDVKKNAKRILIGIGGVLIAIAIVRLILGLIAESVLL